VQSLITALLGSHQRWQPIHRAGTFADHDPTGTAPRDQAATRTTVAEHTGTLRHGRIRT
jgi:hypothetical protein